MARYTREATRREVVSSNGEHISEVKETETSTSYTGSEPPYIKLYIRDILYLSQLPERYGKVILALLKRAPYVTDEGMIIDISAGTKRMIAKQIGAASAQTVSNALTDLTKAKVLKRIETGVYALNPNLFGKGDWTKIAKLRLDIDYTLPDIKTFKAIINYREREEINITPRPERLEKGKEEDVEHEIID